MDQLARWAKANHFQGIELWGIHAKNLADNPTYNKDWLANYGLNTTMISDYLPLHAPEKTLYQATQQLCRLSQHWGAKKIRTFAGNKGSSETQPAERQQLITRLQKACHYLAEYGLTLIIETHPHTFADSVRSTLELINDVNCDNLKINFDVLHVWESKANVLDALQQLSPYIDHFHLKNVSAAEHLHVFSPPNVYSASGTREGMVPLFDGALDYENFFSYLYSCAKPTLWQNDASLEWFGPQSQATLSRDRYLIQQLQQSLGSLNNVS